MGVSVLCCDSINYPYVNLCNKKLQDKMESNVSSKVWETITQLGNFLMTP